MIIDISDLGEVEQAIVMESIRRLRDGQKQYGPWKLERYDNFYEAMCELIDAVHYRIAQQMKGAMSPYRCEAHRRSYRAGEMVAACDDSRCEFRHPS